MSPTKTGMETSKDAASVPPESNDAAVDLIEKDDKREDSKGSSEALAAIPGPDGDDSETNEVPVRVSTRKPGESRLLDYGCKILAPEEVLGPRSCDGVRDVWKHNLLHEVVQITEYLEKYNIVAMDTEFPGIVAELSGFNFEELSRSDKLYETIRTNVNMLKLIQFGITLMDKDGNTPPGILGWQFNFKFDLKKDYHAISSIDLLKTAGLDFQKFSDDGIEPIEFAEQFSLTGLIVSDKVSWVSFHSGYDFAYLYKVLLGHNLPKDSHTFFETLMWLFPRFYDCKFLMRYCHQLHGSLQQVGYMLNIEHNGIPHQAGSDAYLTGRVFLRMVECYFPNGYEQHYGQIFGFDSDVMLDIRQKTSHIREADKMSYLDKMFQDFCVDPSPYFVQASEFRTPF